MKKAYFLFSVLTICLLAKSQTTIVDSIYVGGMYRDFRLYVPAIYNSSTPVPLILNLHGYGSNNVQQEVYGDFRPIADTANFIIVHPNGTYDFSAKRYWNCFTAVGSSPNDVSFLSALIDSISANYSVDPERIYSTGLSNGGFMSNGLACLLSNRITAIASVAAGMSTIHYSNCNPLHPTPVMEIHGTADGVVPYNGSTGIEPVDTVIKYWVDYNQCGSSATTTSIPNTVTTDYCTATNYLYNGGVNGSTVELYKITNGGHTWPGAIPIAALGNTNQDFKGVLEIWRFFRKYKLSGLTNVNELNSELISVNVFPNPFHGTLEIVATTNIDEILIFDLAGKQMLRKIYGGNEKTAQINSADLETALYIIEIKSGGKTFHRLITK
jgi:polyhydroxybutyrate depolymerase